MWRLGNSMSESKTFGFYFEKSGRAGYQGPNDPSSEYFTNVELEESLVREIIQNSMDAKAEGASKVIVEFDLRTLETSSIPDISGIRHAVDQALEASQDLQGKKYLEAARDTAYSDSLPVLRIGDYGTKGLTGSESKDTPLSPLSVLTRGTGVSSNEGARGGSFGIGAAVGLVASRLRTVCYISKAEDKDATVFAGLCRLASHKDDSGTWRLATGYFTRLDQEDDFTYLKNPGPIGSFPQRTEFGTDVYLFGYAEASHDPNLHKIRRSCIRNFMVAIHRGALEVRGLTAQGRWTLDQDSLQHFIQEDSELMESVYPFYKALTAEQPIEKHLAGIGAVKLYLYIDDSMDRPLFTQVMRKPLMKVEVLRHRFPIPYAAIFVCEDEPGNSQLREIEPPTHDHWNTDGPRSNPILVQNIKKFIRTAISERMPSHYGSIAKIKGLERLLPSNIKQGTGNGSKERTATASGNQGVNSESPVQLGRDLQHETHVRRPGERTIVKVTRSATATSDGSSEGRRGERHGGKGSTNNSPKDKPAIVNDSPGKSRIPASSVRFRSFYDHKSRATIIVLTGLEDVSGDLELITIGAGENDEYDAPIAAAALETADGWMALPVANSTIKSLQLDKGQRARIRVTFETEARYRIGVRDA